MIWYLKRFGVDANGMKASRSKNGLMTLDVEDSITGLFGCGGQEYLDGRAISEYESESNKLECTIHHSSTNGIWESQVRQHDSSESFIHRSRVL